MVRVPLVAVLVLVASGTASGQERIRQWGGFGAGGGADIRGGLAKHFSGGGLNIRIRWTVIEGSTWGLGFVQDVVYLRALTPPRPEVTDRTQLSWGVPFHARLAANRYARLSAIGGVHLGRILGAQFAGETAACDGEVCPPTMEDSSVPGATTASVSVGLGAQLWLGRRYGRAFVLWAEHRTDLLYAWLPGGGTTGRSHVFLVGIGFGSNR